MFQKRLTAGILALSILALCACTSMAKDTLTKVPHKQQMKIYPSPSLKVIEGREMKFLIDPAKVGYYPEQGLKTIWKRIKTFAEKEHIDISQKTQSPFALTYATKVYYDTPQNDLRKQGYVVRISTNYKNGQPDKAKLTVKFIDRNDATKSIASMKGVKNTSCEENVGPGEKYSLSSYVEKSVSAQVNPADIPQTLGEFGALIPLLLETGINPATDLVGMGAYCVRMKPGYVNLPGLEKPSGISMEAWLPIDGGKKAFVYDFSFGYGVDNYYSMSATHMAAEKAIQKIYQGLDNEIGLHENPRWGGSKVTYLRDGGLNLPPYKGKIVGNLDMLYGVPALPSYIKYYEVDRNDAIVLNPYLQVATLKHHAVLDPEVGVYNYVINKDGNVAVLQEARHPYGRKFKDGYIRPEDGKKKKPGSKEKFGHTSAVAGGLARIGGEILFDKELNAWIINNKSGRYSKNNIDRTPEQLAFAAKLIQTTVNPAGKPWGPIRFRLAYTSPAIAQPLKDSPELRYLEPEKKKTPYILLQPATSLEMRDFKAVPKMNGGATKAAFNDDPS